MNHKISILKSKSLTGIGVNHGFTERSGGVSPKPTDSLNVKVSPIVPDSVQNISKNLEMINQENERYFNRGALLYLDGGNKVTQVDNYCDGFQTIYGYDGVVTTQKGYMLAITVADCLPILLADEEVGVIGVSHAGWKGSAGKVTTKVVNKMVELGARPVNILAVIGPGICSKCYEVGKDVADNFDSKYSTKITDNKLLLDLVKSNTDELKDLGVSKIEHLDICTYEKTDRFYSARKDELTGRFLAYISLDSA